MFSRPNSKLRVLIDRVVPGVECQRADRVALRIGDFGRADHSRRITRTRGRDGAIERRRRSVRSVTTGDPLGSTGSWIIDWISH